MSDQLKLGVANTRSDSHYPVFHDFPRWQGEVPEGFVVNFLGVITRVDYWQPYVAIAQQYPVNRYVKTDYPPFDEEYFEWIDLLEAIVAAEDKFTMMELGAGFGRWTTNAAAALKHLGGLPHAFIAVEAEPSHFQMMVQHLADNSVDPKNVRLIQAAIAPADGEVGFYVGQTPFGGPTNWYGQFIGGPDLVKAVSLETLLTPLQTVDLIDLDVQGAELDVLEAAAQELDAKVKRVHLGTHGPKIEDGLRSLFGRLGWKCLRCFPSSASADTEWGIISFGDGVQSWLNPTYCNRSRSDTEILRDKLEVSRQEGARLRAELQKARAELGRTRLLEESLGWKIIEKCRRLRDQMAPAGTRRRTALNAMAKKIL